MVSNACVFAADAAAGAAAAAIYHKHDHINFRLSWISPRSIYIYCRRYFAKLNWLCSIIFPKIYHCIFNYTSHNDERQPVDQNKSVEEN